MQAADHRLRDSTVAHADAVLRVVDALNVARGVRYDPPVAARLTTLTGVLDRTGEIATAPSRLKVSALIEDALARVEASTAELTAAASALEDATALHVDPRFRFAALDAEVAA